MGKDGFEAYWLVNLVSQWAGVGDQEK